MKRAEMDGGDPGMGRQQNFEASLRCEIIKIIRVIKNLTGFLVGKSRGQDLIVHGRGTSTFQNVTK